MRPNPELVATLHRAALELRQLEQTVIETASTAPRKHQLRGLLQDALGNPQVVLELTSSWMVLAREYEPMLMAVIPFLQRASQLAQMLPKEISRQPISESETPQPDGAHQ